MIQGGVCFLGKNRGGQNCKVLVVWIRKVVNDIPLCPMQEIEKRKKNAQERALWAGNRVASLTRNEMVC